MTASADGLAALAFDNRFTRDLPADANETGWPRQVSGACYSRVQPKTRPDPKLVAHAREVAARLGLSEAACASDEFAEVFVGNRLLPGMEPFAMRYGGHQFGHWAGQLGDGRAINLGEVRGADGGRWMLQLKGAGPTPYSRGADGLAVLRSSLREFLCSEAMHHLGVPTTRALSLVRTGDQVERDMFYDGRPELEPGAVVCRVARSFTRFGSFEILAAQGEIELLRALADHTIATSFPELDARAPGVHAAWFEQVCRSTAAMVVHWMRVGFVHGVMNTDNMSILGETIDYGPYGWLEDYDPDWTPNTTDAGGRRYRFGHQPQVAHWNLLQLANAIHPLIGEPDPLEAALRAYPDVYRDGWREMMAAKLGLASYDPATDDALTDELDRVLQLAETDMTIFYRRLAELPVAEETGAADADPIAPLRDAYYAPEELDDTARARTVAWLGAYRDRVSRDSTTDADRRRRMNAVNPEFVPRNYVAQLAIDAAEKGDDALVRELLDVFRRPYDEQPGKERFAAKRPEWARHRPGCSMLSCSS